MQVWYETGIHIYCVIHAYAMIIVHACNLIIVHACTMIIVHGSCRAALMFDEIEGGGSLGREAPQESRGDEVPPGLSNVERSQSLPALPSPLIQKSLERRCPRIKTLGCDAIQIKLKYQMIKSIASMSFRRRGNPPRFESRQIHKHIRE